jgi:predicted methyltransferase MtxX (methanogen marker protein 4)
MANLADALLVWDWERFATGVPLGFDAVHHELQRRIQSTGDAKDAVEATVRKAAELLAPFGVPAEGREVTALLYLVDLATRYLTDRQAEAGARLGVLGTWLLPVLIRRVEEL